MSTDSVPAKRFKCDYKRPLFKISHIKIQMRRNYVTYLIPAEIIDLKLRLKALL